MNKHEIATRLKENVRSAMQLRRAAADDPKILAARNAVKRFQMARMASTHADLLQDTDTAPAARFFLEDLYGAHDLSKRDADVERIIPMMEKLLPPSALHTIMEAVSLDALSESLDAAMAERLGPDFDAEDYAKAFREATSRIDRERQVAHVESVGSSLGDLVRVPFIGRTLSIMRTPARLAGLSELHEFLERGFSAFKAMRRPDEFIGKIAARERAIIDNLFSEKARPLEPR